MGAVRCTRGSVSASYLTVAAVAVGCILGLGTLGQRFAAALADESTPTAVAAPRPMVVSRQAALEQLAIAGGRLAESAVREVRAFAALVPEGETRALRLLGQFHQVPRLLSRDELFEFARRHAGLTANPELARMQSENWADLVDRALNEVIARGRIPGHGNAVFRKILRQGDNFTTTPRAPGTWSYNAHGERTRLYTIEGPYVDEHNTGTATIDPADVVRDLRNAGFNGEPVVLDACKTGCQAERPDTISRVLSNHLQTPVLAPTRPEWLTNPVARIIGDVVDGSNTPIPAGDWVLVLPDSWGGKVIRGLHPLAE